MLSKCLIGVATLLICFAVSYDQQHFLNEKELNRQIDQQKGYYHALTEQVLAEREARHNFRHQVAAIKGFLDKMIWRACGDIVMIWNWKRWEK